MGGSSLWSELRANEDVNAGDLLAPVAEKATAGVGSLGISAGETLGGGGAPSVLLGQREWRPWPALGR